MGNPGEVIIGAIFFHGELPLSGCGIDIFIFVSVEAKVI